MVSAVRGVGSALLFATLAGLALAAVLSPAGVSAIPDAPCQLVPERQIEPMISDLGSEITITLGLDAACDADRLPLHLVLVVDSSDKMGEEQLDHLSDALSDAVRSITLADRQYLRIGVVEVGGGAARIKSFLTRDETRVLNALPRKNDAGGEQCVHCGLQEALRVLWNGRTGRGPEELREAILLATAGIDQDGCDALRTSANDLKAFGALVVTTCVGRSCDERCLSDAASDRRFAFRSWDWSFVGRRMTELVTSTGPSFHPIETVRIEDWLAEDKLAYTRGGDPTDGEANHLIWRFEPWPTAGVTRTYHARSIACGRYRTSSEAPRAEIAYNNTFWAKVPETVLQFANPVIEVACAPSPTVPPSTSPTITVTASPVPTRSSTSTPERPVFGIYLPVVSRLGCLSRGEALDLVVAMDVSGSMMLPAPAALEATRLETARLIALSVVDHLQPGTDRAGVLFYGDEELMHMRAPLAECCGAAKLALGEVPRFNGSRMDLAIERSVAELQQAARRPAADRVILLLTDGDLNLTPEEALLDSAGSARGQSIGLQIVVVGEGADLELLARVAGSPGRVHEVRADWLPDPHRVLGPFPRCRR